MRSPFMNPLAPDLDHILAHTSGVWDAMRDARVFVTGGTGFFGCWLLESWAWAWEQGGPRYPMTALTRSLAAFRRKAPHLAAHPAIRWVEGDLLAIRMPQAPYTHVIHAAFDGRPEHCGLSIVEGTRRALDIAVSSGARRFLLTSSGAVYGAQPSHLARIPENWGGGAAQAGLKGIYAAGKRTAEALCAKYGRKYGLECAIARCFAFVGPYLPLDAHFAAGNFLRDRIAGHTLRVNGDGTAVRSYLHAADLAIWLWHLLVAAPPNRPYNVGSERAVSIAELAECVAGDLRVEIAERPVPGRLPDRYVPSCERARNELGLRELIPLEEAIERTLRSDSLVTTTG